MKYTESTIRDWLIGYAWLGTWEEQKREVDCIMSQDGWRYLDARIEHVKGQASGEETDLDTEANEYVLSALYECHDEPHLPTCPRVKNCGQSWVAEIELCPRCGKSAAEHVDVNRERY